MTISSHKVDFAGKPVWDFDGSDLPSGSAVRVSAGWASEAEGLESILGDLAAQPAAADLAALLVGDYPNLFEKSYQHVVDWLVANASRLPSLTALFLAEVTFEECEISWIQQVDPAPVVNAFPRLEVLGVRGGTSMSAVSSATLRNLVFETGGLPAGAVEGVIGSDLPALEDLELWLGTDGYGRTTSPNDLQPLLTDPPPSLRALRLRNADDANELASSLATAPVLATIDVLDLSMGTLTDDGVRTLLAGQPLDHLTSLDLTDNFLTEDYVAELTASGLRVVADRQRTPDAFVDEIYYYPAVTE